MKSFDSGRGRLRGFYHLKAPDQIAKSFLIESPPDGGSVARHGLKEWGYSGAFRYPRLHAEDAVGHNCKAVHIVYGKGADVTVPSLEDYEELSNKTSFQWSSKTGFYGSMFDRFLNSAMVTNSWGIRASENTAETSPASSSIQERSRSFNSRASTGRYRECSAARRRRRR